MTSVGRRVLRARQAMSERADLNAFISTTSETGSGDIVAVKDIVDVRGTITTGGGTLLQREAVEDAAVVTRIRAHDAWVIGKTNLHEWGYGTTSDNPHYGPVRNPQDPSRVAGGSSGGSAVAVATGMCDWAIGADTGGSIRIPAGLCGVVGLKPTLGSIPAHGVFPLSHTLDTLGPMGPDVATTARAYRMLVGGIPSDGASSSRLAVPVGWVRDLDDSTREAWERVSAGLPEIAVPDIDELNRVGAVILAAEAASVHADWVRERPAQYGQDVLSRLRDGMELPAFEYARAVEERVALSASMESALDGVDALLVPATPVTAPLVGEPVTPGLLTRFTRPFNTTGHPAICLPVPGGSLPVGMQLIGRLGQEGTLLRTAAELEKRWQG